MGELLTTVDLVVFFLALIFAMAVGLIVGRKEETSEDYFLAGRKIPWWGVAGSIYGSNVSANHMVGMMGVGFGVGFAQSHFELGAIGGLMVLCYGFLPVYRKLNVYTLSEYLGRRYDERSQVAYAILMIIIMAVVQMVPGLYIGSRSICLLMGGDAVREVQVEAAADGQSADGESAADDAEPVAAAPATTIEVKDSYYAGFVIALAVIAATYTILGGLKAVVWTDFIQSMLLLGAGILVAILVFRELGGWGVMMALEEAAPRQDQKMHLYLPMNHSQLPWTGVLTGLMAMHCFYWGTNQFIVQRALGARSDTEARFGIISAGFLKLLIPFFAIATGVAAYYLFQQRLPGQEIASDAAFTEAVKLVIPAGIGLMGLIAAGLIGAILSSIDSMMNSAATIVTVDIYQRYINPEATDKQLIMVGRISIAIFVIAAAIMAILWLDPNSKEHFFLKIADYQNYLTPGILVAFGLGMLWRGGTATGAFVTIVSGVLFSWAIVFVYDNYLGTNEGIAALFGAKLNFFHRVVGVILLCVVVYVAVSRVTKHDEEKSRLVWSDLGGHEPGTLKALGLGLLVSIVVFAILGGLMYAGFVSPFICAVLGAAWTLAAFAHAIYHYPKMSQSGQRLLLADDRLLAGILLSVAVFMMYYFY